MPNLQRQIRPQGQQNARGPGQGAKEGHLASHSRHAQISSSRPNNPCLVLEGWSMDSGFPTKGQSLHFSASYESWWILDFWIINSYPSCIPGTKKANHFGKWLDCLDDCHPCLLGIHDLDLYPTDSFSHFLIEMNVQRLQGTSNRLSYCQPLIQLITVLTTQLHVSPIFQPFI